MKKTILKIEGMSCSACSNGLEKYLKKQDGIIEANVNLVLATASITYEDKLTQQDLENFIEEAGFTSLGEEVATTKEKEESKLFYILLGILGIFIMYYTMSHMLKLPMIPILNIKHPKIYVIVLFLLTIPYMIYSFDILKNGYKNAIHKMPNMDTLVSIGILSSYIYSIINMILVLLGNNLYLHEIYFESTIFVIYFMKLGRFINNHNKNKTKDAIKSLVTITPSKAHLKEEDSFKEITIDEVKKGDILICLPGDRIAVDGEVVKGESFFDESFITGESKPILKKKTDKVIAGSINYDNVVEYKAEKIGKDSTISEIVRLVVEATNTKAPIAKLADKICLYFVPTVLLIAILTLLISLLLGNGISISLTRFVTVLIVACPCSLGLATPLSLVTSNGRLASLGILVKDNESLEIASNIDTVVLDKTGTLTNGTPTISKIKNHSDYEEKYLLEVLLSIEKYSSHPLATGITKYAKEEKINSNMEMIIEDLPGYGVKAKHENDTFYACNNALLKKLDIINSYEQEEKEMSKEENSIIYLVKNNKVLALIGLKDIIQKESKELVKKLKEKNIQVVMLTGDNEVTASSIANELEIEIVRAEKKPKEKTTYIKNLLEEGHKVMMVGDGINDAPSLITASIGVSLNCGTDIATNSANIVLMNNNILKIIDLLNISKKTMKNIKQNLFWAFLYNIIMIPLSTGIIKAIKVSPMMACIAMILSSLIVTFNALRLRKTK